MKGNLLPPWFKVATPRYEDILIATFFWGFSLSIGIFTFAKGFRQTYRSWTRKSLWSRSHRLSAYIVMIWLEWASCIIISICSWLYLIGVIKPSFWYFMGILVMWTVQVQCLMEILANRVSLIMYNPEKSRRLKWGVGIAIGFINISVFCIWIPARLQINDWFIEANKIWDRIEKGLFLIIDGSLNAYFMWLVRSKLIANGLTKYKRVYRFNLSIVCVSLLIDVLIIATMSLPDDTVYIQAHPLAYLVKLHIEMNMAELIAKVVRKSNVHLTTSDGWHPGNRDWRADATKDNATPALECRRASANTTNEPETDLESSRIYRITIPVTDEEGEAEDEARAHGVEHVHRQTSQTSFTESLDHWCTGRVNERAQDE